ncbi:hypothetical protein ILYODFUR_038622 [Ilyodon furcidens]|uniref:Uncharacterized protein n=1 Tax=Ilyodon furcidens TaxID=33524 RepID=A0ABV0VKL8_9TELE
MPFKKYVPGKFKRTRLLQLLEAIVEVDEEELDSTNNDFPTGQFKISQEIPKPQKQHSYIPQMPMTQLKVRSPNIYRPNQKLSSPTMFTDAEKINSYISRMPITQLKVRRPSFDRPISIPGIIMETQHGASTSQNLLQTPYIRNNQEFPEPEKFLVLSEPEHSDSKKPKKLSLWKRFKKFIHTHFSASPRMKGFFSRMRL